MVKIIAVYTYQLLVTFILFVQTEAIDSGCSSTVSAGVRMCYENSITFTNTGYAIAINLEPFTSGSCVCNITSDNDNGTTIRATLLPSNNTGETCQNEGPIKLTPMSIGVSTTLRDCSPTVQRAKYTPSPSNSLQQTFTKYSGQKSVCMKYDVTSGSGEVTIHCHGDPLPNITVTPSATTTTVAPISETTQMSTITNPNESTSASPVTTLAATSNTNVQTVTPATNVQTSITITSKSDLHTTGTIRRENSQPVLQATTSELQLSSNKTSDNITEGTISHFVTDDVSTHEVASTTTMHPEDQDDDKKKIAIIAGVVSASVFLIILTIIISICVVRRRRQKKRNIDKEGTSQNGAFAFSNPRYPSVIVKTSEDQGLYAETELDTKQPDLRESATVNQPSPSGINEGQPNNVHQDDQALYAQVNKNNKTSTVHTDLEKSENTMPGETKESDGVPEGLYAVPDKKHMLEESRQTPSIC